MERRDEAWSLRAERPGCGTNGSYGGSSSHWQAGIQVQRAHCGVSHLERTLGTLGYSLPLSPAAPWTPGLARVEGRLAGPQVGCSSLHHCWPERAGGPMGGDRPEPGRGDRRIRRHTQDGLSLVKGMLRMGTRSVQCQRSRFLQPPVNYQRRMQLLSWAFKAPHVHLKRSL